MSCPEFRLIQDRVESAREELRSGVAESAAGEFAYAAWERVARTSLFSAEIDAQYHKARCSQCRAAEAADTELLAEAA